MRGAPTRAPRKPLPRTPSRPPGEQPRHLLTTVVIAAALVAGVTGAWSPCGFSMVETLAPSGYAQRLQDHRDRVRDVRAGALTGGVITFGGLALIGARSAPTRPFVAAAIALVAAAGEARDLRIVPQVRRQVPESWRRVMPVPLAAGLYGVLLGLGFTTFILTFAVWALAGISVAVGDPAIGVAIGLASAPAARCRSSRSPRPAAGGCTPRWPSARASCARCARSTPPRSPSPPLTLATAPAQAAVSVFAVGYADAGLDGPLLALHRPGGQGEIRGPRARAAPRQPPRGRRRAPAYVVGATIQSRAAAIPAPGADAVAISDDLGGLAHDRRVHAAPLADAVPRQVIAGNVGRPGAVGNLLVFTIDGRIEFDRPRHRRAPDAPPRGARRAARPSVRGYRLTYIKATYKRQQVLTGVLHASAARPPTARSTARRPTRPPRRRPRAGARPRPRPHQQAALAAPARGVSDTLTTTATSESAVYFTRVRQPRGGVARAGLDPRRPLIAPSSAWVGDRA